eukprot:600576-Rhodomonas_salina.1
MRHGGTRCCWAVPSTAPPPPPSTALPTATSVPLRPLSRPFAPKAARMTRWGVSGAVCIGGGAGRAEGARERSAPPPQRRCLPCPPRAPHAGGRSEGGGAGGGAGVAARVPAHLPPRRCPRRPPPRPPRQPPFLPPSSGLAGSAPRADEQLGGGRSTRLCWW